MTIQNMTKHNTKFIENWLSSGPGLQPWLSWQRCRWRLNSHLCRSHPRHQGRWSAPACHGPLPLLIQGWCGSLKTTHGTDVTSCHMIRWSKLTPLLIQGWCGSLKTTHGTDVTSCHMTRWSKLTPLLIQGWCGYLKTTHGTDVTWCHVIRWSKLTPLLIQGWCWSLKTTHGTDVTSCHMIRWSKLTPLLIQGWCWSLKTTPGTDVTSCHMIRWSKLTPLLIQGWCWSLKTTHGTDVTSCHMIRWSKLTPLLIQGWNTWHWCHMIRSSKFTPQTHWLTDLLEEYCILPGNCPIKSPIKLKSDMFDTENSQFNWAQSPIPASGASSTNKTFHRDPWAKFVTHSKNFVLACNFYVSLSYDNS